MDLKADHDPLPLLDKANFIGRELPYKLITFLNRTLKKKGVIFGLKELGERAEGIEYEIRVYVLGEGRGGQ